MILKKTIYFILLIGIMTMFSCDKEQNSEVPNFPVDLTINLNIHNELTVPGNSKYFSGPYTGFGGVIVYCEIPGSYYAYDATCTHEISQSCKIINEGVLGTCECCDSQFVLIGGAFPSKGPAAAPLRQYQVSMVNSFMLRVYN